MKNSDGSFYVRGIPEEIKASFKAWCARRNFNMVDVILAFMRKVANTKDFEQSPIAHGEVRSAKRIRGMKKMGTKVR